MTQTKQKSSWQKHDEKLAERLLETFRDHRGCCGALNDPALRDYGPITKREKDYSLGRIRKARKVLLDQGKVVVDRVVDGERFYRLAQ